MQLTLHISSIYAVGFALCTIVVHAYVRSPDHAFTPKREMSTFAVYI